ncbi:MAG TPA: MmgE/PrpD family protein [Xanthobacteraceae bacterium]|jgi:2-methylcitrate dehydratase PrpD
MNSQSGGSISTEARVLSEYIAGAVDRDLPAAVAEKTRHHLLDTIAAMISGSRLRAGKLAAGYVARLASSAGEATVVGTPLAVPAEFAALANGIAGHADETDDSHLAGRFHPGCGIVPAVLAVGEARALGGVEVLRATALGYDVGARLNLALGYSDPNNRPGHSTHSLGTAFGAAAAAAALLRLDPRRVRHVLSYAAQQASGVPYWHRDAEHVEKAFDFGGMGARNGVAAALMVDAGFSGIDDPFSGRNHFFTAFGEKPAPSELTRELGSRFEIAAASIKKWCVGSPIQSMLDAATALVAQHRICADDVRTIRITMPHDRMHIVDDRAMPDVCVQHLAAIAVLDGTVGFAAAHDVKRMHDQAVQALRGRMTLIPSPELTVAIPARQAIVEIELENGKTVRHHAKAVRGTPDNPMSAQEIEAKALDLMAPVIGEARAEQLIATVREIEDLRSASELRPLVQA